MFGGGDFASDMAANGWRNASIEANNRANSWQVEAEDMRNFAAENAAVRYSLATQLSMVDEKNPLLIDAGIVEKIGKEGISAFRKKLHFEEAREVGRRFKIPGREKGPPALVPMPGFDVVKLRAENAGLLALRAALVRQLLINDRTNPLIGDPMLQMKIQGAGITAFTMNKENFEAAREAGKTFAIPGRG